MITKTLKVVALGMINRIFGGIFGLLKWGIILSSFVLVTQEINEIITLSMPAPEMSFLEL